MPKPFVTNSFTSLKLQKKQQLWNEQEEKSTEFIEKDSVTMKWKTECEGIVTSGTIIVSGTNKLETL